MNFSKFSSVRHGQLCKLFFNIEKNMGTNLCCPMIIIYMFSKLIIKESI